MKDQLNLVIAGINSIGHCKSTPRQQRPLDHTSMVSIIRAVGTRRRAICHRYASKLIWQHSIEPLSVPGINSRDWKGVEIGRVSGGEDEIMLERGCGNERISEMKRYARFFCIIAQFSGAKCFRPADRQHPIFKDIQEFRNGLLKRVAPLAQRQSPDAKVKLVNCEH